MATNTVAILNFRLSVLIIAYLQQLIYVENFTHKYVLDFFPR